MCLYKRPSDGSPYEFIEKLLMKIPLKFFQEKKQLINKITSIAVCYEMYERFDILIFLTEIRTGIYKDSVMLSISPSLITTNEEKDRVLYSLD